MSYNKRVGWLDHVVERPRTYKEISNSDGSKTFTPVPGEIIQQGTAQSATNFGAMDEALQHLSIAYDMLMTITQAELRDKEDRIAALEAKVATLSS